MSRAHWAAAVLLLTLAGGALGAAAGDWPAFRGPTGQGHSDERGLPLEWSETRHVRWKTRVAGLGWSSPVIAGGRVWLTTALDLQDRGASLRALAFDFATGKPLVDTEVFFVPDAQLLNPKNSFASPTPIVEGDRVYVHFGADGTAALTTAGEIVWSARFPYDSQHGNGGSPVLYGDLLIFNCDGFDEAFVVALDKRTGKVRWKTPRSRPWSQAYSTPLVVRVRDRDEVISVGAFRTVAYDPQSGQEIWRVQYRDGFSNVPRPVFGHGLVYIATGFQEPSLLAVRPEGAGDITRTQVAWTLDRGVPYTPSPLLVDDELYVVSDAGILTCVDAVSGKVHWQRRLGGNYSASPVYADGRIYFQNEEGTTTVIAPGESFQKLATNVLDGAMLASLAVADHSVVIRTDANLYRIATD